jgi:hypothetical protein
MLKLNAKIILSVVCLLLTGNAQKIPNKEQNSEERAKVFWELLVAAKGGREKMNKIENMLFSSIGTPQKALSTTYTIKSIELSVFPSKTWSLEDYRPSVFGLTMRMYNWETGIKYVFDPREKTIGLNPIKEIEKIDYERSTDEDEKLKWSGMVADIPESRWWKPTPIAHTVGEINQEKVDIIQTRLSGDRIDFFLNQKTHLPMRVNFYNFSKIRKTTDINSINLSNYVEKCGLQMPTKLQESDGNLYTLSYEFNVDFDESIFTKPPIFAGKDDLWKKKNK